MMILTALLAALVAPPVQTASPVQEGLQVGVELGTSEPILLHHYRPRHVDAVELRRMAGIFVGRELTLDSAEYGGDNLPNMQLFDRLLIVFETESKASSVLETLRRLDTMAEQESRSLDTSILRVLEYRPRYLSDRTLGTALQPFARNIQLVSPDQRTVTNVRNITTVPERGVMVIRDTEENLEQIRKLLESVDVPEPQVNITCWLVRGSGAEGENLLPADLVLNMSRLLPYRHFEEHSVSCLRSSVKPAMPIRMQMCGGGAEGGPPEVFTLELQPSAYDAETGALTFNACEFSSQYGSLFTTSTRVARGEYTVLGVSGQTSLFVVLRITPVE